MVEPSELVGCFVVEVGERQAWPFLTFCDNRPTPSLEARLYIDARFTVEVAETAVPPDESVVALLALNGLGVTSVEPSDGELVVVFDNRSRLRVSNEARESTVGDVWWLSPWRE